MYCLWMSSKMLARITACRSVSAKADGRARVSSGRDEGTRTWRHWAERRRGGVTHVLEDKVDVLVVLGLHDILQSDYVLMFQFLSPEKEFVEYRTIPFTKGEL